MSMLRNLLRLPSTWISLAILLGVVVLVFFGEALAPSGPLDQDSTPLMGSSWAHPFGTDYLGRDVLSRLMAGSRLSVIGAVEAALVGMVIGVPSGLASVWMGRFGEWVSLRLTDTLMILPFTIFAIAVVGTLGNGLHQAMLAVGILMSPVFFRITRAVALGLRKTQYVEAAELMGASKVWVLRTHIWSKVLPNIAVAAAQIMGAGLLAVASLSFLGIGVVPPTPTWGGVLASQLPYLYQQHWAPIFPIAFMVLTVGSLNILGDGIREASGIQRRRRRGLAARRRDRAVSDPAIAGQSADPVETKGPKRVARV
jgi:peptide/nickel transport system permease protein